MLEQINPIPLDQLNITNYPKTATAHVCIVPLNKLADQTRIQQTKEVVVPLRTHLDGPTALTNDILKNYFSTHHSAVSSAFIVSFVHFPSNLLNWPYAVPTQSL